MEPFEKKTQTSTPVQGVYTSAAQREKQKELKKLKSELAQEQSRIDGISIEHHSICNQVLNEFDKASWSRMRILQRSASVKAAELSAALAREKTIVTRIKELE